MGWFWFIDFWAELQPKTSTFYNTAQKPFKSNFMEHFLARGHAYINGLFWLIILTRIMAPPEKCCFRALWVFLTDYLDFILNMGVSIGL